MSKNENICLNVKNERESMFKTNPLRKAMNNIWLYQMRNAQNKRIAKKISTHKERNKQLNTIEKDLF